MGTGNLLESTFSSERVERVHKTSRSRFQWIDQLIRNAAEIIISPPRSSKDG